MPARAIAGVLALLPCGAPVVLAQTREKTLGIGADDLNARLDRYIARQRVQPRHEARERLPLETGSISVDRS